ncbi:MAG: glycine cleavage system protein GcvH [Gammaproteobacteria bacterium]|nr:glycine cleavage system protein GcvH [Gammaproteobacteria bacterium]
MSEIPAELKYSPSHEWIRVEPDGTICVGITHHAQDLLGDMVFIELPEVGRQLSHGEECAVIESVKAASDIYAPLAGTITAVNNSVEAAPELLNQQPYGDGWILKMQPDAATDLHKLLDAAGYSALVASEA